MLTGREDTLPTLLSEHLLNTTITNFNVDFFAIIIGMKWKNCRFKLMQPFFCHFSRIRKQQPSISWIFLPVHMYILSKSNKKPKCVKMAEPLFLNLSFYWQSLSVIKKLNDVWGLTSKSERTARIRKNKYPSLKIYAHPVNDFLLSSYEMRRISISH